MGSTVLTCSQPWLLCRWPAPPHLAPCSISYPKLAVLDEAGWRRKHPYLSLNINSCASVWACVQTPTLTRVCVCVCVCVPPFRRQTSSVWVPSLSKAGIAMQATFFLSLTFLSRASAGDATRREEEDQRKVNRHPVPVRIWPPIYAF